MTHESLVSVLLLVALLQCKHFVCDGPLQTYSMVKAKGTLGQPIGLAHGAIHGVGTLLVLVAATPVSAMTALGIAVADSIIHYFIDFVKENVVRRAQWTTSDGPFWWAFAADQTLHQLTYLAIAYLVLKPA